MTSYCPYCSIAIKKGELFCSCTSPEMTGLKCGIFYVKSKKVEECDWHVTRLSLNFNLDANQSFFIGNHQYKVSPSRYLLITEGQSFKTVMDSPVENRSITLAFTTGLADEIFTGLSKKIKYQLDNPFVFQPAPLLFEKTYNLDDFLLRSIHSILGQPDKFFEESLQSTLENILEHFLIVHNMVHDEIMSIEKLKTSTKIEIYRRLTWAKEYIHTNFQRQITIDDIARQACLSSFHFKRLFKAIFKITPHQYIKQLRLRNAEELLTKGFSTTETCRLTGWEDPSSFIRLFKSEYCITPGQYRHEKQNHLNSH